MAAQNDSTLARLDTTASIERRRHPCSGLLGWASVPESPPRRKRGATFVRLPRLMSLPEGGGRSASTPLGPTALSAGDVLNAEGCGWDALSVGADVVDHVHDDVGTVGALQVEG